MYGKLFISMYDGTLATKGPWEALVTFQQFLILCDRFGMVDMTADAISRRTTIPLEIIERGIIELEKPDPDSRSPDENGCRILRISDTRAWGWQVVNYEKYRTIKSADERREYMRQYQKERRAAAPVNDKKQSKKTSAKPEETLPPVPDWLDEKMFMQWFSTRPAKARTAASLEACVGKLDRWRAKGHDPLGIVATSLANGWQGIFEPKEVPPQKNNVPRLAL